MQLAKLPYDTKKYGQEIVALRGINYSDSFQDGDMADSENISARRWPYISTRLARKEVEGLSDICAIYYWDKLVAITSTGELYYGGEKVEYETIFSKDEMAEGFSEWKGRKLTGGPKQFAAVNTKLVIWPDAMYLDMNTKKLVSMNEAGYKFEAKLSKLTFEKNKFTVGRQSIIATEWPYTEELTQMKLVPGSMVSLKISGSKEETEGKTTKTVEKSIETTAKIGRQYTSTGDLVVEFEEDIFSDIVGSAETADLKSVSFKAESTTPNLDYICSSNNRLWGCSSSGQTIYVSALGDPTNFAISEAVSTDAYAVAVASPGPFTGCSPISSSVLFFKEERIYKMLGNMPSEYYLFEYETEGLKDGCHKSMKIINDTLFYMGPHGVHSYNGGTPVLLSDCFGRKVFTDAVGATDGQRYGLSVKEGDSTHFFMYEPRIGIWVREESARFIDSTRSGRDMYLLSEDGRVWIEDGGGEEQEEAWAFRFKPFYEIISGRKRAMQLLIRTELAKGSYFTADMRFDGGRWQEVGRYVGGKSDVLTARIPINRCDKYELRLRGKGPCTILSIMREFIAGSEV